MKSNRLSARGQVLIIFVFAIIGLMAIAGLAIDGGNIYADRRQAQNAADTAALAAALARNRWEIANPGSSCGNFNTATHTLPGGTCDPVNPALNTAQANGYANNGGNISVDAYSPPIDGVYSDCSQPTVFDCHQYIEVVINDSVETWFARVIGIRQLRNSVRAVAREVPAAKIPVFPGDAIIGLDPGGSSFDSGMSNAVEWAIHGGGVFANHNAFAKNGSSVVFDPGYCVTAVSQAFNFGCTASTNNPSLFLRYPTDITPMLPPIPACDGTAYTSGGLIYPEAGKNGSVVNGIDHQFAPGLYCIKGANGNIHSAVTGTGVTFYIMDDAFTMKYNGGGSFAAQAPTSGTYAGLLMFSHITPSPCRFPNVGQQLQFRGNGSSPITGTIFMPSACIDWRGNSTGPIDDAQLIGYDITSNGNADIRINYDASKIYKVIQEGRLELTR